MGFAAPTGRDCHGLGTQHCAGPCAFLRWLSPIRRPPPEFRELGRLNSMIWIKDMSSSLPIPNGRAECSPFQNAITHRTRCPPVPTEPNGAIRDRALKSQLHSRRYGSPGLPSGIPSNRPSNDGGLLLDPPPANSEERRTPGRCCQDHGTTNLSHKARLRCRRS